MKIKLTKEQQKNLVILLNRVQITGAEVQMFISILKAIHSPIIEEDNQDKK